MTPAHLAYVLHGLLIIAVLLAWFYSPWQGLLVGRSRERLIELRRQWLTLIAREHVPAEQPAARMISRLFDVQIQSLQCMSLQTILAGLLVPSVQHRGRGTRIDSILPDLPEGDIRGGAQRLQDQAALTLGLLIVMRSLVCWVCVVLLAPAALCIALGLLSRRALGANSMTLREEVLFIRGGLLRKIRALTEAELSRVEVPVKHSTIRPAIP